MLRRNSIIKKISKATFNKRAKKVRLYSQSPKEKNKTFYKLMQRNIEELDNLRHIESEFSDYMYRVFLQSEKEEKALKKYKNRFDNSLWMNKDAILSIAAEFENSVKEIGFNSEILKIAFEEIAKIYQVRGKGSSGSELTVSEKLLIFF